MSDLEKLDKLENAIKFIKENTVVVGFLCAAVPAIFGFGYTAITEINKAKDALSQFTEVVDGFGKAQSDIADLQKENKYLKERVQAQQDTIGRMQDKLTDAVLDAKEAKSTALNTEKSTTKDLKLLGDAMKSELNAIKRASSNRLGQ